MRSVAGTSLGSVTPRPYPFAPSGACPSARLVDVGSRGSVRGGSAGAEPAATSAAATAGGEASAASRRARRRGEARHRRGTERGAEPGEAGPGGSPGRRGVPAGGRHRRVGDLREALAEPLDELVGDAERGGRDEVVLPEHQVADRSVVEGGEVGEELLEALPLGVAARAGRGAGAVEDPERREHQAGDDPEDAGDPGAE